MGVFPADHESIRFQLVNRPCRGSLIEMKVGNKVFQTESVLAVEPQQKMKLTAPDVIGIHELVDVYPAQPMDLSGQSADGFSSFHGVISSKDLKKPRMEMVKQKTFYIILVAFATILGYS